MKKGFILGLVCFTVISLCGMQLAFASDSSVITGAIEKYKNKNYLGCISDLNLFTEKDTTNAVAWYYLGSAYMNISMNTEAHAAFEKVVELNTVPKLTSYAIQAELCMENKEKCKYENFSLTEIKQLKADPSNFLKEYFEKKNEVIEKDPQTVQIENLINGSYANHIHPEAQEFIRQERLKMKQNEINADKA